MEQGSSWVAKRPSASQEIPRIVWKAEVHYRIHKLLLSSTRPCEIFHNIVGLYGKELLASPPTPLLQAEKKPSVGCPRMLI